MDFTMIGLSLPMIKVTTEQNALYAGEESGTDRP